MLVEDIIKYGAHLFGVAVSDIYRDCRLAHVCRARFAIYLALHERMARRGEKYNASSIGSWMRRHHTSVIYGIERARCLVQEDARLRKVVEHLATVTDKTMRWNGAVYTADTI